MKCDYNEMEGKDIDYLQSISYENEMTFEFNNLILKFTKSSANIWKQQDSLNKIEIIDKFVGNVLLSSTFNNTTADELYQSICYSDIFADVRLNNIPQDSCRIISTYVDNYNIGLIFRNNISEVLVVIPEEQFDFFIEMFFFYYLVDIE